VPTAPPVPSTEVLIVRPWPDPVIDAVGHDPRSAYVEQFWLSVLGPSTTWLIRRIAAGLEANPAGFPLDLASMARELGVGHMGGRHSPFVRALGRVCQFELAQLDDDGRLHVRRKLPPLNRRQIERLPESLQADHARWVSEQLEVPAHEHMRRRARQLALSLFELGEDTEGVERQLLRWRIHPGLASEARAWAWARYRELRAGGSTPPPSESA
jgi:hypothetical protein